MRATIAIDADDVLFDENKAIRNFANDTYGFTHTEQAYLTTGDYAGYWQAIWAVGPAEYQEMYQRFLHSPYKYDMKPVEGAISSVRALKEAYDLVIVTSRGQALVETTHLALAKHYPGVFEGVHFVPLWASGEKVAKATICNEIGATYLIDDNAEHCALAVEAGIQAVLFGDYGWNREENVPDQVVRCKNWDEVTRLLLGR